MQTSVLEPRSGKRFVIDDDTGDRGVRSDILDWEFSLTPNIFEMQGAIAQAAASCGNPMRNAVPQLESDHLAHVALEASHEVTQPGSPPRGGVSVQS